MDQPSHNDENSLSPRRQVLQMEKRKPTESPFSAFSPAQRLAKKKGRVLCEPGDANLETTMMDETQDEEEFNSSTFSMPKYAPKVLFAEGGDEASESLTEALTDHLSHSFLDPTQGDRTFSAETRPVVPSFADPNLDETYLDTSSMNVTYSAAVIPTVPSAADPNLEETLAEITLNQSLDATLSSSNPNAIASMGDALEAPLPEDAADRTLGEDDREEAQPQSTPLKPVSLFDELNATAPPTTVDGEGVTAESALPPFINGGRGGVSLFDEMNGVSGADTLSNMNASIERSVKEGELDSDDEVCDEMNESGLSTLTARVPTDKEQNKQFYANIKQRLSQINVSLVAPRTPDNQQKMEDDGDVDNTTPTRSGDIFGVASPHSGYQDHNQFMSETFADLPGTPTGAQSRFSHLNDSTISFMMHEADVVNEAYIKANTDMQSLQEELAKSREHTEKVEKERDVARKEIEDYVYMMETTKKRMMNEKSGLSKQILELEQELSEARRLSSVVEAEGRKVEEIEMKKEELEQKMKQLEEDTQREAQTFAAEKERLAGRVAEMEKQIEEERKVASEETERRVRECKEELEKKMEEMMRQKNELIGQLEKMECETGDKEFTSEEKERELMGLNAMLEAEKANWMSEKKRSDEELERATKNNEQLQMRLMEVSTEMEAMKGLLGELEQMRAAAFEESKMANGLTEENEELKRVNEGLKKSLEENEKDMESIRVSMATSSEGRMREMEERMNEMEREKKESEGRMESMKMEVEMARKMETRVEEMMKGFMKKTEETTAESLLKNQEILDLKKKMAELELEVEGKQNELAASGEARKEWEREMELLKGEAREKVDSMEESLATMKKEAEEATAALDAATLQITDLTSKMMNMEGVSNESARQIEEKEKEMIGMREEMQTMIATITELTEKNATNEETWREEKRELEGRLGATQRELEIERNERRADATQSSEMEALRERLVYSEGEVETMKREMHEAEARWTEMTSKNEELEKEVEKMNKEKEEMDEKKASTTAEKEEEIAALMCKLEQEREEKKALTDRLEQVEEEKTAAERVIEEERERISVLAETVKELETELAGEGRTLPPSPTPTLITPMVTVTAEISSRLEEELEEAKGKVKRLETEVNRLGDLCDEFDEIENRLNNQIREQQNKIDLLEGKTAPKKAAGPALLDALKPSTKEIKSMDETVNVTREASPPREIAGKEEGEEEMKEAEEEYGTPAGSILEGEDREMDCTHMGGGRGGANETLGVTRIGDVTRLMGEEDEEEEKTDGGEEVEDNKNVTRKEASCRQS